MKPETNTLRQSIVALHAKIRARAKTHDQLMSHPDATPEMIADVSQRNREYHLETRRFHETLREDLKLIGVVLLPYADLATSASPFGEMTITGRHNLTLPFDLIARKIRAAKAKLAETQD